jgi:hypothetical protein
MIGLGLNRDVFRSVNSALGMGIGMGMSPLRAARLVGVAPIESIVEPATPTEPEPEPVAAAIPIPDPVEVAVEPEHLESGGSGVDRALTYEMRENL